MNRPPGFSNFDWAELPLSNSSAGDFSDRSQEKRSLVENVIESHGGSERWKSFDWVSSDISFGGLAFLSRFNRAGLLRRRASVSTHRPFVILDDFPSVGSRGIFTPNRVWIESNQGLLVEERAAPRDAFRLLRRSLWWDDLDLLYFAGYALWNYLSFPFLLAYEGVDTFEIGPWKENGEEWRRLAVRFPDHIPTHSTDQTFYFDSLFRLKRFDYDPLVYASWAHAAHYCSDYEVIDGILIPGKRTVVPRSFNGQSRRRPTLVWIELNDTALHRGSSLRGLPGI